MAVVDYYGAKVRNLEFLAQGQMADVRFAGPSFHILDGVSMAAGDSINSKIYMGKVPSAAVLLPTSQIFFGAAGASVTLDIGDALDPDGIATLIDISAAGSSPLLEASTATLANRRKRLWELLGYTTDPDRLIDLFATIKGAALSNATPLDWLIQYGRG